MRNFYKRNSVWIFVFSLICIICIAIIAIRSHKIYNHKIAQISLNGEIIRTIDISHVDEPYEFRIDAEGGYNIIRVEKGRISVSDADCPDKICVNQGFIDSGTVPIVCLPHKLSISISDSVDDEADAVALTH